MKVWSLSIFTKAANQRSGSDCISSSCSGSDLDSSDFGLLSGLYGAYRIGLAERRVVTVAVAAATDALRRSCIGFGDMGRGGSTCRTP